MPRMSLCRICPQILSGQILSFHFHVPLYEFAPIIQNYKFINKFINYVLSFVIVAVRAILRYPTILHEQGTRMFMAGYTILLIILPLEIIYKSSVVRVLSNALILSRHV